MTKLTLEVQDGTATGMDGEHRVHFYPSSQTRYGTDEPLLAIASSGRGMRMTIDQVKELHAYLGRWLESLR